jgi:PKD repeat protein
VGGLVGLNEATVENASASGTVNGSSRVGGLVGRNDEFSTVRNAFATGTVTGSSNVDALVGVNDDGTVGDLYWDVEATGRATSNVTAAGLTTAQMTGDAARTIMTGLDFGTVWQTRPDDYPVLTALPAGPESPSDGEPGEGDTDLSPTISTSPRSPTAGQTVIVAASVPTPDSVSIERYSWMFGDGSSATGEQVSHAYESAGEYTLTLTIETTDGRTVSTTREVDVQPDTSEGFGIEGVTPYIASVPAADVVVFEDLPIDLSYSATVTDPANTSSVRFSIGGTTYTDPDGSDGWTVDVPVEQLDSDAQLVVTAVGTDGQEATTEKSLSVIDTPDWFGRLNLSDPLEDDPVVVLRGTYPPTEQPSVTLPNQFQFPFADQISIPIVGEQQDPQFQVDVEIRVNLETRESEVTIGGSSGLKYGSAIEVSGAVDGTGYFDVENVNLERAEATAEFDTEATVPPTGIPSPPLPPVVPPGVVRLYPIFGIDVSASAQFDEVDSPDTGDNIAFEFTEGQITPDFYAQQELGQEWERFELIAGMEEGVEATLPLPGLTPFNGTAYVQFYARAKAYGFVNESVSYPSGDDLFEYDFENITIGGGPDATGLAVAGARSGQSQSGWGLTDRTGPAPPGDTPATLTGGELVPNAVTTQAVTGTDRLTQNTVADKQPAIARTPANESVVVWSRQDPSKSVLNGREIYLSTTGPDGSFGSPQPLTADSVGDHRPDVAANSGGNLLAAFTSFDETFDVANMTRPSDLYDHGQIRITLRNGSGWSDPTYLTNTTTFDYEPTLIAHNDSWLVVWTRDGDANLTTWQDRSIQYAWLDANGTVSQTGSINQARRPVVSSGPGDTPRLAYLNLSTGPSNGTVVVSELTPGDRTQVMTHSVTELTDLAYANDTLAWATRDNDALATVANGSGTRTLEAPANTTPPQDLGLVATTDTSLLTFRAHAAGSEVARTYYKPRVDGEWLSAQRYADGGPANVTYWQESTAPTEEGFVSVLAGKDLNTDQKHDLFAFRTGFRPDLSVSATANDTDVRVGETVTLNYTVRNQGVNASDTTAVVLRNGTDVVRTTSVGSLPPGAMANGSFTAPLDASGRFELVVDPADRQAELDAGNNAASVVFRRPDLAVSGINTTRKNGTLRLRATVRNPTNVTTTAIPYRIENGPNLTQTGMIPGLNATERATVAVDLPVASVDARYTVVFRADPDGVMTKTNTANNDASQRVLQPDLGLTPGQVNYYQHNGTVIASVLLANQGSGYANGTIQFERVGPNGTVLGTGQFSVSPVTNGTTSVFTSQEIALDAVTANETVRALATVRTGGLNRTTIIRDSVELNTTLQAPTGTITPNKTIVGVNDPVRITATDVDDVDGSVTVINWTIATPGGVQTASGQSVTVTPGMVGTLSIELTVTDDDDLTTQESIRIGVVNTTDAIAAFEQTRRLTARQTTPNSLAGKLSVEAGFAAVTNVRLRKNDSSTYSFDITAPDGAENVTVYLQSRAISASQEIQNLTMYLDGEEHPFLVNESAGPGASPWVAFNIPHFSTRTVTFSTDNATLSLTGGSIAPETVNESVTESHDVGAVFENVSRDGSTDTFAITFPDAVAGGNLSADSATVTDLGTDEEISITSSLSKVDGPDQDGIRDTLRFAVSPDGGGTIDVAANVSVDVTWPEVDANTTYTVQTSAEDSATGNVSLTPVANATVLNTIVSPEPSITITPETPETGTSVTFDASESTDPDGSIVSYDWDLTGDGSIDATGETVSYTYSSSGDYTVSLTVTDDDGATNTTTTTVAVTESNDPPQASFTVSSETPEAGSTVTFDASTSTDPDGTITSYEWDFFDNGSTDATGSTASVAYSEAGEYTVSLIVSDGDGATAEATQTVTVNAPPTAQISITPTDPEVGQEVTFTATASTDPDGSIETYQWDLTGDGTVDATGAEVTRTYESSDGVQITLTVIDDDGSETQAQIELTVQPEQTTTPGGTGTTTPEDPETTTPGNTETTAPRTTETTTSGDIETTAPGETETTVPEDTEPDETTGSETGTDVTQEPDNTETQAPGQPGFGIGTAIAGLGGAGYMLKRRLNAEDDEQ